MDRKWRTNRDAIRSVAPYQEFAAALPPRGGAEYTLAATADLYAVYTVLHIERKECQLHWSPTGSFYYFIAVQQLAAEGGEAGGADAAPAAPAPEGDEDLPAQVRQGPGARRGRCM